MSSTRPDDWSAHAFSSSHTVLPPSTCLQWDNIINNQPSSSDVLFVVQVNTNIFHGVLVQLFPTGILFIDSDLCYFTIQ